MRQARFEQDARTSHKRNHTLFDYHRKPTLPKLARVLEYAVLQGEDLEVGCDWRPATGRSKGADTGVPILLPTDQEPGPSRIVEETTAAYGFDSVSFITVNAAPCRLNEVANKVDQFRTSLRNIMQRRCPQVSLIGEFEVIQEIEPMSYQVGIKGIEKISKVREGLETTHPGIGMVWIRLHLHAMAVHPGLTRDKLAKILRPVFGQHKAVRIDAIRDRVTAGGRWFNGTDRAAKYLCDKSSAVKGEQRTAIDLQKQTVAFDAYCRMTRGTRRRHGFSIGARELANFLRSLEQARAERAEGQRLTFVERLRARAGRAKRNERLHLTLACSLTDSRL